MLCYALLCYAGQSNSRSDSERCPPLAQTPVPMPKLFHPIIMALRLCFCASSFNLVFPVFLHLCPTSTDTLLNIPILNSVLERSIIHNTQSSTEKVYNTLMYLCPLLACRPISSSSPSRADNPPWTERTHGLTGLEIKVMPSLSSLLPVYCHVLITFSS